MRGVNLVLCAAAALIVPAGLVQTANAQISIQIGGAPPSCPYGYYNYAPYRCAPRGYWGPNYFYNGIFLGVGPWANWGYDHGWGGHRFSGARRAGDRPVPYHGGGHPVQGGHGAPHGNMGHGAPSHGAPHGDVGHGAPSHGAPSHGAPSHGESHGTASHGGGDHGGGDHGGH